MEIYPDRDHVAIVAELLVDAVLVFRFNLLQQDVPIGAIDGEMFVEEELESAAHVSPEPILRIVEIPRPTHSRVIPTPAAENEGGQPRGSQRINQP